MQAGILNFIGAYILTIFLFGIWKQKTRLIDIENKLNGLPVPFRLLIPLILIMEFIYVYFGFLQNNSMSWLNILFWGPGFLIHEAGHVYAGFLGIKMIHILGGTFLQYLLPAIVVYRSYRQKCYQIATITLFWTGIQLESTANYISSATAESSSWNELTIGIHDWKYILGELNMISFSPLIANLVWSLGMAISFCAILVHVFLCLYKNKLETNEKIY